MCKSAEGDLCMAGLRSACAATPKRKSSRPNAAIDRFPIGKPAAFQSNGSNITG
jgi:hypothetical protein